MAKPIKPPSPVRHSFVFRATCPVARRVALRYLHFERADYPVTCPDCKAAMVEFALATDRDENPDIGSYNPSDSFESW